MKLALLIVLLALSIGGYSQTADEKIRAKKAEFTTIIEQIERLKMEQNFTQINTDTLDTKKAVISFGKKGNQTVIYLKIGNNNYRMNNISINMDFNGEIYNLKNEGDTLKVYGDKGVNLFKIF